MVGKSLGTLATQFGQVAISVGIAVVVTRLTGPEGKGIYTFVTLVALVVTLLSGLGLSTAATYFVGKGDFPRSEVASTLLLASVVLGLVSVVIVLGVWFFGRFLLPAGVGLQHIELLLLAMPALPLTATASGIVLGTNRPIAFATIGLVQVAVTLLFQMAELVVSTTSATAMLVGWLVGVWSAAAFALALVIRRVQPGLRWNPAILRACLGYGSKAYAANLAALLNYRLDSLLISNLAGLRSLGYYSVAVSVGEMVWYLSNAVSSVLFPHVASLERGAAARVTAIVCRNTILISLAGCLVLLVGGKWVILLLFGPSFLPALPALWLLLPGVLALSAGKVIASYLSGIGKPIYASIIAPGNLVLTVVLDLLLIPPFGYLGAAVASSIVYIAATVAGLIVFRRESGASLLTTVLPQVEDIARWRGLAVRGLTRVGARSA